MTGRCQTSDFGRCLANVVEPTPRKISAFWAVFAWSRVIAYWGFTPKQLALTAQILPTDWGIELLWGVPAVLLTVGAFPLGNRKMIRVARSVGGALLSGVFAWWATVFLVDESSRSWLSATTYATFAVLLLSRAVLLGRDRPPEKGVVG